MRPPPRSARSQRRAVAAAAQMLIESGALHAGELACASSSTSPRMRRSGEALGLLGRIRKRRYVTSRRPEDLIGAIAAYSSHMQEAATGSGMG